MFGLSTLGLIHTLISLIAVIAGIVAFVRDGRIKPDGLTGQVYIWATVVTCLTGFGIFAHGGFGKPHALGILTLIVLGVAVAAGKTKLFGRSWLLVETVSYSTTFFFHMIPGVTETTTRLPAGNPVFPDADAPGLVVATGLIFILFLVGVVIQLRRLKVSVPELQSV
ncbi:hypothetical protein H8L32_23930 [Undibacterium sp. CY18W]|uniref:DUF2306 domain-containing protein n=1 Tax=Undibacterium hunanense TaxID=2762292 RepID=A0ABR6ZY83_9BURK|nr:hypothetical protein [Undibacterium hunanense]MBC3920535.1 hypothetical protein [Undibacterium hunanense]